MPLDRLKSSIKSLLGQSFDRKIPSVETVTGRAAADEDFPTDAGLLARWQSLVDATSTATPFQGPLWQAAVHATQSKPNRYRLITLHDNLNQLIALLPLHLRDDGLLETLAPGVSDYLDPLIAEGRDNDAWPILLKVLAGARSQKFPAVTLHNIRETNPARTLLPQLAPAYGFSYEEAVVEHCPLLPLPKTWDDYLATLDAHERKETRRKVNKAVTKANAQFTRCPADPIAIRQAIATTLTLMEQAPGEKGEAVRKILRPLLEKAAPALIPANQLWLTTLTLNGQPAGVTLQFPTPSGPLLYNCGFDATQKEFSPGVVLVAETIRQAIESGAPTYDLLRGQEPYKYRLGAVDRPLYRITLRKT